VKRLVKVSNGRNECSGTTSSARGCKEYAYLREARALRSRAIRKLKFITRCESRSNLKQIWFSRHCMGRLSSCSSWRKGNRINSVISMRTSKLLGEFLEDESLWPSSNLSLSSILYLYSPKTRTQAYVSTDRESSS